MKPLILIGCLVCLCAESQSFDYGFMVGGGFPNKQAVFNGNEFNHLYQGDYILHSPLDSKGGAGA